MPVNEQALFRLALLGVTISVLVFGGRAGWLAYEANRIDGVALVLWSELLQRDKTCSKPESSLRLLCEREALAELRREYDESVRARGAARWVVTGRTRPLWPVR